MNGGGSIFRAVVNAREYVRDLPHRVAERVHDLRAQRQDHTLRHGPRMTI